MTDQPRSMMAQPGPLGTFSDAARRASDTVNTHLVANRANAGRYVAIRLSDGTSDGVVYDTRRDAIAHQLHESQCAYVRIPPTGMPVREADAFLNFCRKAYDAGFRMPDPDTAIELVMPTGIEELRARGIIG